ncbi:MAG: DUF4390 domain-containing protein [Candidatus Rokubacteria bacterium]|nr:DUF4390 domain-containing protein [Candidatus Rokubacteria bacterium]
MRALGRAARRWVAGLTALGTALGPVAAAAELRISNLNVFLNDLDLTVELVLLEAIPPSFHERLQSGLPVQARVVVELWQYSRFWMDSRIEMRAVDRQLTYSVLAKEYKVASTGGEQREPYLTKDLREAQRVLSDVRGLKLAPASALPPQELFYVRARAEVSVGGPNTFSARLFGQAEETPWVTSPLLTVTRRQ